MPLAVRREESSTLSEEEVRVMELSLFVQPAAMRGLLVAIVIFFPAASVVSCTPAPAAKVSISELLPAAMFVVAPGVESDPASITEIILKIL